MVVGGNRWPSVAIGEDRWLSEARLLDEAFDEGDAEDVPALVACARQVGRGLAERLEQPDTRLPIGEMAQGASGRVGGHSDGTRMALGRHSDGTRTALGWHSDGTRMALMRQLTFAPAVHEHSASIVSPAAASAAPGLTIGSSSVQLRYGEI